MGLLGGSTDTEGLDIDPTILNAWVKQFGATDDEKKQARLEGILAAGLKLMGARKGQELQQFGEAGLLGLATRNESLKNLQSQRGSAITQALAAQKLAKEMQFNKLGLDMLKGGEGGLSQGGASPVGPQLSGAPMSGGNPRAELAMALAGKKDVADVLHRQNKIEVNGGVMTRNGQLVGQIMPQGGAVLFEGGDPSKPKFYPTPQEAMDAAAKQAGAVKGAESEAAAKYDMIPVPMGGGQTQMMSKADALAFLRQQQPQFHGAAATPGGMARAQQDFSGQRPFERPEMGGPGLTPSPLALKQGEEEIQTTEQGKRTARTAQVANSQTFYEDLRKQYVAGRELQTHLANMAKLEEGGVFSGPVGALGAGAANWINSAFPDADISGAKLGNAQTYTSEIGKMQQAIARTFPGSQSDRELQALTASLPNLMLDARGRAQVRDTLARKAADAEVAYDSASQHYRKEGDLIGWKPPAYTPPTQDFGGRQVSKRWVYRNGKMEQVE